MFVTSGLKLELPLLCAFSFPLPWQSASADDGYAFSWGTQSEGDNNDNMGVETPANLQEDMQCGQEIILCCFMPLKFCLFFLAAA